MDVVTNSYAIDQATTTIASPLGGGIYINIGAGDYEDAGLGTKIMVTGTVLQAPNFQWCSSGRSWCRTTEAEWQDMVQGSQRAPWADFKTDKYMTQVPTKWLYGYTHAEMQTMALRWDMAMDGVREMVGFPEAFGSAFPDLAAQGVVSNNNEVLYLQPDLHNAHQAYGVGYPQVNTNYQADAEGPTSGSFNGRDAHWLLTDPTRSGVEYHELGHCMWPDFYRGEGEALVNLYYGYIFNNKIGKDVLSGGFKTDTEARLSETRTPFPAAFSASMPGRGNAHIGGSGVLPSNSCSLADFLYQAARPT